jgi:hypothetical protein
MKRAILFKAIKDDVSNCKWVYGQLVYDAIGQPRITEIDKSGKGLAFHTCINGTECQFTGLLDKNGNKIFEGDKIKFTQYIGGNFVDYQREFLECIYSNEGACFRYKNIKSTDGRPAFQAFGGEEIEIIGNIHD